jgi:DNA modification methylase
LCGKSCPDLVVSFYNPCKSTSSAETSKKKALVMKKTLYFPSVNTDNGVSRQLEITIDPSLTENAEGYLTSLSNEQILKLLGNPSIEDLVAQAKVNAISVGDQVTANLNKHLKVNKTNSKREPKQLSLFASPLNLVTDIDGQEEQQKLGITFRDTKTTPINSWYPYVEGFSADYVKEWIAKSNPSPKTIYDPFGGSGTVQLAASLLGIHSLFSEVNPFMRFVAETKVNATAWIKNNVKVVEETLHNIKRTIYADTFVHDAQSFDLDKYNKAFPDRDFFVVDDIKEILLLRQISFKASVNCKPLRDFLLLGICSQVVACSNMTRRADLRRRRDNEYKNRVVNVRQMVSEQWDTMLNDILCLEEVLVPTEFLSGDAREPINSHEESVDFVITSPPYLNGTNYFRNTKLELWVADFITTEEELSGFREKTVTGGINDVSSRRPKPKLYESVERVACMLDNVSPDKRIPQMVRAYFSDMEPVLRNVYKLLKPGGKFVIDLGDSQFYGVHVPTDVLLCEIAQTVGYELEVMNIIARRHSRDKTPLRQVEIILIKPKNFKNSISKSKSNKIDSLLSNIDTFKTEMPYRQLPYSKKTWGGTLHSLCSYQGKLKPAIAHWLIKLFSKPGDIVLDPLCGVGTIPFEAAIQGRKSIGTDLSPLAYTIAKAKVNPPTLEDSMSAITSFMKELEEVVLSKEDWESADFGLNATVKEYYHEDTLQEVLKARKYFLNKKELSPEYLFIKASILHILHGNRPYALSRTSHPITPFSPKGEAEYRSLVSRLTQRIERALSDPISEEFIPGSVYHSDFRKLPDFTSEKVDVIITSPPFVGMRFDRPNWLRLWFCGWEASDFHQTSKSFLERQQGKNFDVYQDFFSTCRKMLKPGGTLILHLGGSEKNDMVAQLEKLGAKTFSHVATVVEDVTDVETHGVKDRGQTSSHHFVFFN